MILNVKNYDKYTTASKVRTSSFNDCYLYKNAKRTTAEIIETKR